jgi:glycosyltransferase involved in cell wall biosynthesis
MLVMPVYNEEACVAGVIEAWRNALRSTGASYRMLVVDDGSTDGTAEALSVFDGAPDIRVVRKANSGHGPTILTGYAEAVEVAEWIFQCDSDDEMPPDAFPSLWREREDYDALFGVRTGRRQSASRRLITQVSRIAVRMLFGAGVADVNSPYRLMRADVLAPVVQRTPAGTYAPNVIISGALASSGCRIANVPVGHVHRRTGSVSIAKWRLWKLATGALVQTIGFVAQGRMAESAAAIKEAIAARRGRVRIGEGHAAVNAR